jgi:hypothetical protein
MNKKPTRQVKIYHKIWNENHPDDLIRPGDGYAIHHKDEDYTNNSPDNLEKIPFGQHSALHQTGRQHTEKTKQKIGKAHKGKIVSQDTKNKLAEINKGENNPRWGRKFPEAGIKISKALTGKYPPGKHYLCGRKCSEETKQKMKDTWAKKNAS